MQTTVELKCCDRSPVVGPQGTQRQDEPQTPVSGALDDVIQVLELRLVVAAAAGGQAAVEGPAANDGQAGGLRSDY